MTITKAASTSLITSLAGATASHIALNAAYKLTLFKINGDIYIPLFSTLLFAALLLSRKAIKKTSFKKIFLGGTAIGYALGIFSFLIAEILEPGGFDTLKNTFCRYGFATSSFLFFMLLPALLSCSWLIGGGAFLLMKKILTRT